MIIEILLLRILGFFIILLPNLNFNSGNLIYVFPALDSIIIFFWTIANPNIFNQCILIILGIYYDIITGLPLGFNALIYLVFYNILLNLRKYFVYTSFYVSWIGFAVFSGCFLISKYLLTIVYYRDFFIATYLPMQWLVLFLLYPSIHAIFNKIKV